MALENAPARTHVFCAHSLDGRDGVIWADRVAVVWGVLLCGLYATGALTEDIATWSFFALFVLMPWLLLRGLDWIVSGGLRWHPTPPHGKSP